MKLTMMNNYLLCCYHKEKSENLRFGKQSHTGFEISGSCSYKKNGRVLQERIPFTTSICCIPEEWHPSAARRLEDLHFNNSTARIVPDKQPMKPLCGISHCWKHQQQHHQMLIPVMCDSKYHLLSKYLYC